MALDYFESGKLAPVSKTMSGGGSIPGGFLQLLVGLPLSFWYDYRAPAVFLVVFHLAAGILAALAMRQAASGRAALLFTVVWWLSPWRLYHSAFLWEPNYLFLPAALHFWACWRLRKAKEAVPSAILAATLVLTLQIHGSFLYLVVLTAVLAVRRMLKFHWQGALLGTVAGSLTLVSTMAAWVNGTLSSPAPTDSFYGYGLVKIVPFLRGISYWFRMASLDLGRRLRGVVYLDGDWQSSHPWGFVLEGTSILFVAAALLSILLPLYAAWWWFRKYRPMTGPGARWLRCYVSSALLSVCVASALSPVTLQSWHLIIALPAACIPVTFWIVEAWPAGGRVLRTAVFLYLILRLPITILLGNGHPTYRLDEDIASKLQPRQQTLLPERYRN